MNNQNALNLAGRPSKLIEKIDRKIDKKEDLTLKQRLFLKEYIRTGNATRSALKIYDCKDLNSAAAIGYENLRKLQYDNFLEEMGLTDVVLVNTLATGLTKANKIHGTEDNFIEIPDHATRHKYLETALKLKRRLTNDNTFSVNIDNRKLYVELPTKDK